MKTTFGFLAALVGGAFVITGGGTMGRAQVADVANPGTAAAPANHFVRASEFPKLPNTFNWDAEEQMNDYFVQQFIDSANFGNRRMIPRTMMIDDAMRLIRHDPKDVDAAGQPACYQLDNLELIGIARHATPVAFIVNRHERNGTNFSSVTTRPLTEFETKSLDQLRAGSEAVVQTDAKGCLVVGPVRARELCLECHAGAKVGDVLGAFSYKLTRLSANDFRAAASSAPQTNFTKAPVRSVTPQAPWSPVTSEPVEKDGLAVVIQSSREIIPSNEPLALRVTFRNKTDQPLRLPNNTAMYGDWLLKLEDVQSGKKYTAGFSTGGNQTMTASPSAAIQPGDTFVSTAAYFANAQVVEGDLNFDAFQKAVPWSASIWNAATRGKEMTPFQPGDYKVWLEVRFPNQVTEDGNPAAVWKDDDIVSQTVLVKIGPVPAEKTGSIAGHVLDRQGRPAANATLTCHLALPYTLSPPVANSPYAKNIANRLTPPTGRSIAGGGYDLNGNPVTKTDAQGAFVIANLPPGTYVIGAQLPPADELHWIQDALTKVVEVKENAETKLTEPMQLDYNRMDF